jgi:hypothetical protein
MFDNLNQQKKNYDVIWKITSFKIMTHDFDLPFSFRILGNTITDDECLIYPLLFQIKIF